MRIEKITFELTTEAVQNLRDLKRNLEKKNLPIKQREIVDYLLREAKLAPLLKHFAATTEKRIGADILDVLS